MMLRIRLCVIFYSLGRRCAILSVLLPQEGMGGICMPDACLAGLTA